MKTWQQDVKSEIKTEAAEKSEMIDIKDEKRPTIVLIPFIEDDVKTQINKQTHE